MFPKIGAYCLLSGVPYKINSISKESHKFLMKWTFLLVISGKKITLDRGHTSFKVTDVATDVMVAITRVLVLSSVTECCIAILRTPYANKEVKNPSHLAANTPCYYKGTRKNHGINQIDCRKITENYG